MPVLTPEQEALKQAALAATPGPWDWDKDGSRLNGDSGKEVVIWTANIPGRIDANVDGWGACLGQIKSDDQAKADADYIAAANPAAILALLAQLEIVQADRRIAWFDALTQRAESMGFVSIEDALDGFDATRKAAEDRAMQTVQAVPDGAILVRPNEIVLGRGRYPVIVMRTAQKLLECMSAAVPGEPGQ